MNVSFNCTTTFEEFAQLIKQPQQPQKTPGWSDVRDIENPLTKELNKDAFKLSKKGEPKVQVLRIWFNRLTQEQIDAINESGKLPKNIKIRPKEMGTGYYIYHNIFNMYNGTQTMPEGYELRKNRLGFTRLVPKDTEGFWLPKNKKAQ